jgi:transposase-like protein
MSSKRKTRKAEAETTEENPFDISTA